MDPRHPEQAIPRVEELFKHYLRVLDEIRKEKIPVKIGGKEREALLVIQDLLMTVPRLQDAMIVVSRTRRAALAKGLVDVEEEPQEAEEEEAKNEEEVISDDGGEMGEERGEEEEATEGETEEENGEEESEIVPEETTVVENLVETPLEEDVEKNIENAPNEAKSESNEIYVAPNQAETIIAEIKPRKKKAKK